MFSGINTYLTPQAIIYFPYVTSQNPHQGKVIHHFILTVQQVKELKLREKQLDNKTIIRDLNAQFQFPGAGYLSIDLALTALGYSKKQRAFKVVPLRSQDTSPQRCLPGLAWFGTSQSVSPGLCFQGKCSKSTRQFRSI